MNENNNKNTFDNDSTGEIFSWIIILILMFAFWPVGLGLLLKKLRSYAKNPKGNMTVQNPQATGASADISGVPLDTKGSRGKRGRSQLEKKSGRFLSTVLLLISIILFIVGGNQVIQAAGDIINYGISSWSDLGMGVFYFIGGFISLLARNTSVRRYNRYKKYFALVGGREIVPVSDIAAACGESEKSVRRDLQSMIDEGYFGPSAYIDVGLNSIVLSAKVAEAARKTAETAKSAANTANATNAAGAANTEQEKPENQYMAIINELRSLNDTIADIPISDKIDRIESITAKIFRIVEENPAKLPQIRRFMNYYLPTTLKLLHSYATLEKQGIKGENISAAKENIDRILETLATGFEQQLDLLFKDDAIDISADINVLEKMMRQDGLSGDAQAFKTMESGGL